jgi:glycosyltransferase involved in cell wall biosynthesis
MTCQNNMGLSLVVPAYNEQDGIRETLETVDEVLKGLKIAYELVVVNDGSTDETRSRIEEFESTALNVINHPTNSGYGAALKAGIRMAKYEVIGIIDADGSYEVNALRRLYLSMEEGFDMSVATRKNISEKDKLLKGLFRKTLHWLIRVLIDRRIEDLNSGLRMFRRSRVIEFLPFLCNTFSFTTSLTIFFFERGHFVAYVPTTYVTRKGMSKVRHGRDTLRVIQMIIQGVSFFNPIKIFIFIGIAMVILVCIPAMVLAMMEMATLSAYFMLFGSVMTILFALGIIGDIVRVSGIRSRSPVRADEEIDL